ncbi:MAG: peptidylprolyl isomerase [Brachymonas sp.]|nr:peptidylprolyl isomerase [Brachymonas sp.]
MKNPFTPSLRQFCASALLLGCAVCATTAFAQNVAVVNGKPIPKARLDAALAQFQADATRSQQALPPDLEGQIRAHLIKEAVIVQQAESRKLHLTPEYADKMASARGAILGNMLFEQYKKDHPISDAAAKAQYDRVLASLPDSAQGGLEYNARHILVKTAEEARKLQAELAAGKSFEALARKHSIDPGSGKQGGELGWSQAEAYVPAFANALKKLKKGQTTSAPVKTQFGYHIIRLEDSRKPQPPAFEMVKEQIKQQMQSGQAAEFEKYLSELEKKARIQ